MKIYIETYGCSANISNSEIIEGVLRKVKHKIVSSENDADLVIINTCIVKGPTENRMIRRMQEIKKPVVVCGCMVDAQAETIRKTRADAILVGLNNLHSLPDAIIKKKDFICNEREIKLKLPKKSRNKAVEIIQIAEGCLGNCSYCITKIAKGKLFSYPEDLIVDAVRKSKAKEIWLTSQDCGAYGMDIGTNLPSLLRKILKLKKKFLIRVGMMNPNHAIKILDDLIEIYNDERIFKFLHIPLQSGNDEILLKMNRNYKSGDFSEIIKKFRKSIPKITIATDVICGFPCETPEQFEDTVKLIEKTMPDTINISKFWPRQKTLAARMRQVDVDSINERSKRMKELSMAITTEKNKSWLGWEGSVYVDEIREDGQIVGRNFAYKQIVLPEAKKTMLGKTIKCKIVETGIHYLRGTSSTRQK